MSYLIQTVLQLYVYTVVHLLHFHLQTLTHFKFSWRSVRPSEIYNQLGQFSYGQPHYTKDCINACIEEDYNWIYVGEVKEGTDDIPHGIGIKVYYDGSTQQLNDKV